MLIKRCLLSFFLSCLVAVTGAANPKENVAYVDATTREAVFTLQENPSTGFRWFVTSMPNPLIETVTYRYEAPSASVPGKPGMATLTVLLSAEAMTIPRIISVQVKSARAWEPEVGQEKTLWIVILA